MEARAHKTEVARAQDVKPIRLKNYLHVRFKLFAEFLYKNAYPATGHLRNECTMALLYSDWLYIPTWYKWSFSLAHVLEV